MNPAISDSFIDFLLLNAEDPVITIDMTSTLSGDTPSPTATAPGHPAQPTHHIHVEGSNVSSGHEGEIDMDGYLIDHHHETEQFSHTREVRELEDHLEILQHDSQCLQLEEVKSKETVRRATAEEMRALLAASVFDGKDEIEIGTEITVEGFVRVEQTHEETVAGGATTRSMTVTETREKEELNETPSGSDRTPRIQQGNAPSSAERQLLLDEIASNNNNSSSSNAQRPEESQGGTATGLPNGDDHREEGIKYGGPESDTTQGNPPTTETDEGKTRSAGGGLIGYIKERSRSLSRNRSSDYLIKDPATTSPPSDNTTTSKETKKKKKEEGKKEGKKKWTFGKKTDSTKEDGNAPTSMNDDDILRDKKKTGSSEDSTGKNRPESKTGDLINSHNENGGVSAGATSPTTANESGSKSRNSWSLFRKKSDRRNDDKIEKKEPTGATAGNTENDALDGDEAKRKHSTNSLQRGIRNIFSGGGGKKDGGGGGTSGATLEREDTAEETVVTATITGTLKSSASSPPKDTRPVSSSKNPLERQVSVNSVNTSALSAGCAIVIGISVGATVSGYSYCVVEPPYLNSVDHGGSSGTKMPAVRCMRKPDGSDPGINEPKFPSALLVCPEGEFHSFGFTARNVYRALDAAEATRWMYFEDFGKHLADSSVTIEDSLIRASNGQSLPARRLLEMSLQFLSFEALRDVMKDETIEQPLGRVRWVIAAPPGWRKEARHWIRQAAYNVGLSSPADPQRLVIVEETLATAAYVHRVEQQHRQQQQQQQHQQQQGQQQTSDEQQIASPELLSGVGAGSGTCILVDCGGEAVKTSVYGLSADIDLVLIYQRTINGVGATGVDREFIRLLLVIFSDAFLDDFRLKRPTGWTDLTVSFESCKRSCNPRKENNQLNVPLPFSFIDHHQKYFGYDVEATINKYADKNISWTQQGMLRLQPEVWTTLFRSSINNIQQAVQQALVSPQVHDVKNLWLTGGFADCLLLKQELQETFKQLHVSVAEKPSQTTITGAIYYGLNPTTVTFSRVTNMTSSSPSHQKSSTSTSPAHRR